MQQQLVQIDRLGQVVIRAGGEARPLVLNGVARRHQHDGQARIAAAQFTRQLPAVHHRHHHVGNDQIGHHPVDGVQRFLAVGSPDD